MTTREFQQKSPLAIFLSYFRPHRKLFIMDLSCALMISLIDLAFPYVSRWCMYELLPQNAYRTFFAVMAVVFAPREVLPGFVVGEHDDHIGLAAPQRDVVAHDFILDRILQGGVQNHFDPLSADKTHLHDAAAKASVAHHFDNRRRFAGLQFG